MVFSAIVALFPLFLIMVFNPLLVLWETRNVKRLPEIRWSETMGHTIPMNPQTHTHTYSRGY